MEVFTEAGLRKGHIKVCTVYVRPLEMNTVSLAKLVLIYGYRREYAMKRYTNEGKIKKDLNLKRMKETTNT